MLNTVYNLLYLLLGIYLIYCGNVGRTLSDKDEGINYKLFISLMVNGLLVILYSVYAIYVSFSNV